MVSQQRLIAAANLPSGSEVVKTKGLKEFMKFQASLPTVLLHVTTLALQSIGKQMYDATQGKVPVRTGRLKRSGGWVGSNRAGEIFMSIFYDAPYALAVDLGTSRFAGRHYFFQLLEPFEKKVIDDINQKMGAEFKKYLKG